MNPNKPVDCLRCHAAMELGFIGDLSQAGYRQQIWYPGVPQPSFWTGLKMKKEEVVPVLAMRCPNCGYLESYAIPQDISQK